MRHTSFRICRVTTRFVPEIYGPVRHALDLSRAQRDLGNTIVVVTTKSSQPQVDQQERALNGIVIKRVGLFPPNRSTWLGKFAFAMSFVCLSCLKIIWLHKRHKFDLIHVHSPVLTGVVAVIVSKITRVPFVYTAHGLSIEDFVINKVSKIERVLEVFVFRNASMIIVVSKRMVALIKYVYRIPATRVLYIPNAVDIRRFNPALNGRKLRQSLSLGNRVVTTVSLMNLPERIEGIRTLLRAFAEISKNVQSSSLLIVGDGKGQTSLEEMAFRMGLKDKVRFLGIRHNIQEILAATDVFVLSSYREGTPHCILEAMAMSKPIVATNVGGIPELTKHGKAAILVSAGDVYSLAKAIQTLLFDDLLASTLKKEARRLAEFQYNWMRVAHVTQQVYERAIEK